MPISKLIHEVHLNPPIRLGKDGFIGMDSVAKVCTLKPRISPPYSPAVRHRVMPVLDGLKRRHQDIDAVPVAPYNTCRPYFRMHSLLDGLVAGAEAEAILFGAKAVTLAKLLAGGGV